MGTVQEEQSDPNRSMLLGDYASSINTIPKKRKGSKKGPSVVLNDQLSSGKKININVSKKMVGSDLKSVISKHDRSTEHHKKSLHKKTLVMENIT